jgi:hypothetical protein
MIAPGKESIKTRLRMNLANNLKQNRNLTRNPVRKFDSVKNESIRSKERAKVDSMTRNIKINNRMISPDSWMVNSNRNQVVLSNSIANESMRMKSPDAAQNYSRGVISPDPQFARV